ncbi:MAG TPA: hypothetical protein VFP26_05630 [Gemmatimonadaceae bacterium]|nr:hypothetical protein [Gemmatimonadaceae bacterium]
MADSTVVIAGIPIPSSSPGFLTLVGVHVAAGIVCVIAGVVAMLSPKRPGRHPLSGSVYFWALIIVFATMAMLAIMRWPADIDLLLLGFLSLAAAVVGRRARRELKRNWPIVHVTGMAVSYIALLTAFYVDNGPHLPLWNRLPALAFWLLPSAVGLPLLIRTLRRHPLIVAPRAET